MIYIDPGVYALGRLLTWVIFYFVFKSLYRPQKFYPLIILFILSVLADMFLNDLSYPIVALMIYFAFEHHQKLNLLLINTILLTSLVRLISETLANVAIIIFYAHNISTHNIAGSLMFVLTNALIKLFFAIIFVVLYKYFNIEENWGLKKSGLFSLLSGYLFIVLYIFMRIIQHDQAYSDLISGILMFILIQCTFIVIIFLKSNQNQKEAYSRDLTKEQLKNLKMYTDQLEHDQIKLRAFEQNYKGTISGLRTIAHAGDYQKMKDSLGTLEDYSNSYFDNISMQLFKDLNNVQNPYLKSLFISKLTLINQNNIDCHFECRDVVNEIPINIFDLVRLLGISLDNALEATKGQANSQIQIAIIQEEKQLSFIINNTIAVKTDVKEIMQEGFTTKRHHSGFGLVNVQDIKKKYPSLFVQYHNNNKWFNLSIIIIK